MLNIFNCLRLKRQAPTSRPPKGYYELRISKANGVLVVVDEDGTETPVALTTQTDGTIKSANISDATTNGSTSKGKVLKTDANGDVTVTTLTANTALVSAGGSLKIANLDNYFSFSGGSVSGAKTISIPDASGVMAVAPSYADESAANAALDANVVYFNQATGKFQTTTA